MSRVVRPATAFGGGLGLRRKPRVKVEAHLAFIRTLPSLIKGEGLVEAAHIRFQSLSHGKRETGKSEKPHDWWVVPLCQSKHREQHGQNEKSFWLAYGIDPLVVAALLWVHSGDESSAVQVINAAQRHHFRPEF